MAGTCDIDTFPRGIIFDVDGTLYRQAPVRWGIALKLSGHLLRHPDEIRLLQALMKFRSLRETEAGRTLSEKNQLEQAADSYHVDSGCLRSFVQRWMFESPLPFISRYRNAEVISEICLAKERGAILSAYSDFQPVKKLDILGVKPDFVFYPGHGIPDELKPSRAAMREIVRKMGTDPRKTVYYGDRLEKDGLSASFEDVRYINVNKRGQSAPACATDASPISYDEI